MMEQTSKRINAARERALTASTSRFSGKQPLEIGSIVDIKSVAQARIVIVELAQLVANLEARISALERGN